MLPALRREGGMGGGGHRGGSDRGRSEGGSKSVDLGHAADNVHSLALLEPMNQVGGLDATRGGQSTDTYLSFANEAGGTVDV